MEPTLHKLLSSASELPSEPAELLMKNGILSLGRCCFHREQKLGSQLSSLMRRAFTARRPQRCQGASPPCPARLMTLFLHRVLLSFFLTQKLPFLTKTLVEAMQEPLDQVYPPALEGGVLP